MASMCEVPRSESQGGPQKVVKYCKLRCVVAWGCSKLRFWSHLLLLRGLPDSRKLLAMISQETLQGLIDSNRSYIAKVLHEE